MSKQMFISGKFPLVTFVSHLYPSHLKRLRFIASLLKAPFSLLPVNCPFARNNPRNVVCTTGDIISYQTHILCIIDMPWLYLYVFRFVPYIGIVTILMNDYPKFKVSWSDSTKFTLLWSSEVLSVAASLCFPPVVRCSLHAGSLCVGPSGVRNPLCRTQEWTTSRTTSLMPFKQN